MSEEKMKYAKAKKRVEVLKGFYMHLIVYVIINVFLFALNMVISPDSLWFYWPLVGWGLAILIHALSIFVLGGRAGADWEEKKIKEEMEKG